MKNVNQYKSQKLPLKWVGARLKKSMLQVQWFIFLVSSFFLALVLGWLLLAQINFAYPVLYDYAGIGENIVNYAPKNTLRPDFDQSPRVEHIRLFAGIVDGIHQQGEGLAALRYDTRTGKTMSLLTQAELIHLQDVAHLYEKMKHIAWLVLCVWLILVFIQYRWRFDVQAVKFLPYGLVLLASVALVLLLGAEEVFYYLHTVVFPTNHQWFFYYEESLMSMMMKAPDLFAYIAVMLVVLALFFTIAFLWLYRRYALMRQEAGESR